MTIFDKLNSDIMNLVLNCIDIASIINFKLMCHKSNEMNLILTNFDLVYEVKPIIKQHNIINNKLDRRNGLHLDYSTNHDILSYITKIKRPNIKYLLKYKNTLQYIRIKFFIKKSKYQIEKYSRNSTDFFKSSGYYINDNITDEIIQQFDKLKVLKLSGNNNITDIGLSKLPNIEILHMPCNKHITLDDNVQLINFRELNIYGNRKIPSKNLLKYPSLRKISVYYLDNDEIDTIKILKLAEIKTLISYINDEGCKNIKNINKLKLKFGRIYKLTGKEFENFLCESCRDSGSENKTHSGNCIKYLYIYTRTTLNNEINNEYLNKLVGLEHLTIMNDDLDISHIKKLKNLKTLCLPNDRNLTLEDLGHLPNLEKLDLVNNKKLNFQNKDLKKILPKLIQLNISTKYIPLKSMFKENGIKVTFDQIDIPCNYDIYILAQAAYTSI